LCLLDIAFYSLESLVFGEDESNGENPKLKLLQDEISRRKSLDTNAGKIIPSLGTQLNVRVDAVVTVNDIFSSLKSTILGDKRLSMLMGHRLKDLRQKIEESKLVEQTQHIGENTGEESGKETSTKCTSDNSDEGKETIDENRGSTNDAPCVKENTDGGNQSDANHVIEAEKNVSKTESEKEPTLEMSENIVEVRENEESNTTWTLPVSPSSERKTQFVVAAERLRHSSSTSMRKSRNTVHEARSPLSKSAPPKVRKAVSYRNLGATKVTKSEDSEQKNKDVGQDSDGNNGTTSPEKRRKLHKKLSLRRLSSLSRTKKKNLVLKRTRTDFK
jgi:hypothetical protein